MLFSALKMLSGLINKDAESQTRNDSLHQALFTAVRRTILAAGTKIVEEHKKVEGAKKAEAAEVFIGQLIALHQQYRDIVVGDFDDRMGGHKALKEAFEEYVFVFVSRLFELFDCVSLIGTSLDCIYPHSATVVQTIRSVSRISLSSKSRVVCPWISQQRYVPCGSLTSSDQVHQQGPQHIQSFGQICRKFVAQKLQI
jgi:hypothetical protein